MAAPLASAAELDLHMQRAVPPDVSALVLAGASGAVRSHCGWDLSRETRTFTVDGAGGVVLTLPTLHLVSVSAVRIDGLPLNLAVPPMPIVHPRGQLIWAGSWPANAVIEVDAVHGYDEIPDVIRLVTLTIAARIVNNPDSVRTASVGSVTRTYDPKMTALDVRLLDPYRL